MRITVTGLRVPSPTSPLPSVMFGSAPAAAVSLVVSDMDATILSARTPPRAAAGVVEVVIGGEGNATFAYMTAGASATCISPVCEVDAVAGGGLTMRVGGLGAISSTAALSAKCTVDGTELPATATSAAPAVGFADFFDVALTLPGAGSPPSEPLTTAFMSLSAVASTATVYAVVMYRSPPRVAVARFSSDGSRIDIAFDQRTNAQAGAAECARFVEAQQDGALGAGPMCSWSVDGQTLSVMLGKGAAILVGDAVLFLAGTVRSLNGVSSGNVANSGSGQLVTVAAPTIVLPPRYTCVRACLVCVPFTCVCGG